MASKQINGYTAANSISATADYFLVDPGGTGTYKKINRSIMLGGITGNPVGTSDSQTLSSKTLDDTNSITVKDSSLTVENSSDTTKKAVLSAAGITTGTTRTLTLPNRSDTLVTLAGTETLTNKTITSPTITGGTIDNSTVTVDSISGHTSSTIVTVGGVQMNNGTIGTSGAVTSTSIAAGAVQPQALTSGTGTGWSWTSYTPTVTLGGGGSNGNAVISAAYIQIGKTVQYYCRYTLGSTTSFTGVTTIDFSLPVAMTTNFKNSFAMCGYGIASDTNNNFPIWIVPQSTTTARVSAATASGSYAEQIVATASVPVSFATNYFIAFSGTYEAA